MKFALVLLAACAGPDVAPPMPVRKAPPPIDAAIVVDAAALDAAPDDRVWLKGSTHVHARASGDSSEPNASVVAWYVAHGYDFIVLTDHNRVSEIAPDDDTNGAVALHSPDPKLLVLAGIELTHNPVGCLPQGDAKRRCRVHVNLLGATARPGHKLEWAERKSHERVDMYQAALNAQKSLGGIPQINHPQWFWGMTAETLVELEHRGFHHFEVYNNAFKVWGLGDATHPSTDQLWDSVLVRGGTLWGIASDDAHDYEGKRGKYPAGGGWIVVHARRDPQAILDAIASGHFYASSGVELVAAEPVDGELVVTVAPEHPGDYTIDFIEGGAVVQTVRGTTARRAVPVSGYVRAIVTRADGAKAWVQPARAESASGLTK